MAIKIDFSEKYGNLIHADVPATQVGEYPQDTPVPEKYCKQFTHPENGFVKLFCEEYEEEAQC